MATTEHYPHMSGDTLHNLNSYAYLKQIRNKLTNYLNQSTEWPFDILQKVSDFYDTDYPYGNLYTKFLTDVEKKIHDIKDAELKKTILDAIFINDCGILEWTAQEVIEPALSQTHDKQTFSSFEKKIRLQLNQNQENKRNMHTPQEAGSDLGRAWSSFGESDSSKKTCIRSVRNYKYKENKKLPIEIRMGTQAIYINEINPDAPLVTVSLVRATINPTFDAWISEQEKHTDSKEITHIYFNLLGRDRTSYEGEREKKQTEILENFETQHRHIAIITLPADKGLFDKKAHQSHAKIHPCNTMFEIMLNIAMEKPTSDITVRDFHISHTIKKKLYGDYLELEEATLRSLIKESFKKILEIENPESCELKISSAQRQAVYFHLMKYELPNYIIKKLQPHTFNMTCKDGIDRGGVASLYYNLMKSIEFGQPLSEAEFNMGLHAAATLVKGRGINHHANLIWNAIDAYVKNNKTISPDWLIKWRNQFAPQGTSVFYIQALQKYREKRTKGHNFHNRFFSTRHTKDTKIQAAGKLKQLIENPDQNDDLTFSQHELNALQEGNLGKIFKEMASHGINLNVVYLQQLKSYKKNREAIKNTYTGFFGLRAGFSATEKTSSAAKLIKHLEGRPQVFNKTDLKVLHNGKLGEIVKAIEKNGFRFPTANDSYLISELSSALTNRK